MSFFWSESGGAKPNKRGRRKWNALGRSISSNTGRRRNKHGRKGVSGRKRFF